MTDHIQSVEEVLASRGYCVISPIGNSMRPLLRPRRDSVEIRPAQGRLKRLDVALYRQGDKLILHRVVKVSESGYVIRGDNCDYKENVTDGQIVGVITAFYRGNKRHTVDEKGYRLYSRVWVALYPARWVALKVLHFLVEIKHKLFK